MKLILGSDISFLLEYGYNLTGIPKEQMKIGYITTASKGDRTDFNKKLKQIIKDNGYSFEEIDIEGKTKEELINLFKDKNIIHIEGGSTFYLLRAIRKSGFAEVLKEFLEEGKIYIGTSAGSYIMCPTIEVSDWDRTGKDRFGVTDFTALNYVSFVLKAHYTDEKETEVKENMKNSKYPIRLLKDGQGILIEDDNTTFFGKEPETVLNTKSAI
ncbi:MAG: Type 1 glutamine amidotransferase-like domain-containing protein [Parcubacteria group bacterium]